MRRFLIMVCLIALALTLTQVREKKVLAQEKEEETVYSGGIKVDLTEEEVQEATNWGRKNKDLPGMLLSFHQFGSSGPYEERGTITTKFSILAIFGSECAKSKTEVDRALIETILNYKLLGVTIHTLGDKIDFAKGYHIVLKQGEKVIQPVSVADISQANTTLYFPQSPSYVAEIGALFPQSAVDPKAKTTVILIKDRGESRFEVDFSMYK